MAEPSAADVAALLQQAARELRSGQLARARAAYESVLRLEPAHFEALLAMGSLACESREIERGIEFFHRALAARPDHVPTHCNLGTAYKGIGRLPDALASYERAIALNPDFAEAHYNRGNALKDLARLEEAVASYDRALLLRPDLALASTNRGIALLELGLPEQALASVERAIAARPASAQAHNTLGNVLSELGRFAEAAASYERAIALMPELRQAHVNLGNAWMTSGRFERALESFLRALRLEPRLVEAMNGLSDLLAHVEIGAAPRELSEAIVRCLDTPGVDSHSISRASSALLLRQAKRAAGGGGPDLGHLDAATGGLLGAHLQNALVADLELEGVLMQARAQLLLAWQPEQARHSSSAGIQPLIWLACQGFLNEYIWPIGDAERERLEILESTVVRATSASGVEFPVEDLLLLGAYRPLHELAAVRSWCTRWLERLPQEIKPTLVRLVGEPARELELASTIEALTPVEDSVSLAVQEHYEAYPYPRWTSLARCRPVQYTRQILKDIAPHRPVLRPTSRAPRVLIAGCGTGKHPLSTAQRLADSQVLAVDLSRASLAYAQRKALELGVANIRFAQADISRLPESGERYDVIECSGVLHHMADPAAGLDALLRMLRPGGFIRIGLYSEAARQPLARLRLLAERLVGRLTRADTRSLRTALIEARPPELDAVSKSQDFYSTSMVRDMLQHVQEHCFTLPQLAALIGSRRLEFLGFILTDPMGKQRYVDRFPDDPQCLDLENWHALETDYPQTFAEMYRFWCRMPV